MARDLVYPQEVCSALHAVIDSKGPFKVVFPRSFLRHTMLWNLPGGEKAATSVAWDSGSAVTGLDSTTVDAFETLGESFWADLDALYSDQTNWVGSRLAWIGTDGRAVETAEMGHTASPGIVNRPPLPSEVAVCISLKTALNNRRGRGRFYLPSPQMDVNGAGGLLTTSAQDLFADYCEAYFTPIIIGAETYFPTVASKTGGLLNPVTSFKVGNVFDSQRRRRDRLTEVYDTRTL